MLGKPFQQTKVIESLPMYLNVRDANIISTIISKVYSYLSFPHRVLYRIFAVR